MFVWSGIGQSKVTVVALLDNEFLITYEIVITCQIRSEISLVANRAFNYCFQTNN